MGEKKFDFVEEVIRKKPNKGITFLKKMIPFFALMGIIALGVTIFFFLMEDNIKQLLSERQTDKKTDSMKIELSYTGSDNKDFAEIEEGIDRSIVSVYKSNIYQEKRNLLATGVIINYQSHLYILTSESRLKNNTQLIVEFADGEEATAQIWVKDEKIGIVILVVDTEQIEEKTKKTIQCATIRATENLERSMDIIYQGNPYGDRTFVFNGTIAGISENEQLHDLYLREIYTDISIMGVDEGFVFDYSGNLIGMVLEKFTDSEVALVSVSSLSDISKVLEKMLNQEDIAYMGISGKLIDDTIKQYMGEDVQSGIYITNVDKDSGAYKAGIMAGDVIVKIDGKKIEGIQDLQKCIIAKKPQDSMIIILKRKIAGQYKEVSVTVRLESR